MATKFVATCENCQMPLTEEQLYFDFCIGCRAPLDGRYKGYVPNRCNACGAVVARDALSCHACKSNLAGGKSSPAFDGRRERSPINEPLLDEYAQRLLSLQAELGTLRTGEWVPADAPGWALSGVYITDEMADYIIDRAVTVIFSGFNTFEFSQDFKIGLSFAMSREAREAARYLVRRLFRAHALSLTR